MSVIYLISIVNSSSFNRSIFSWLLQCIPVSTLHFRSAFYDLLVTSGKRPLLWILLTNEQYTYTLLCALHHVTRVGDNYSNKPLNI